MTLAFACVASQLRPPRSVVFKHACQVSLAHLWSFCFLKLESRRKEKLNTLVILTLVVSGFILFEDFSLHVSEVL